MKPNDDDKSPSKGGFLFLVIVEALLIVATAAMVGIVVFRLGLLK